MSMLEYKIMICGSSGCGKSCIVTQLLQNLYVDYIDPTIEDSYRKQVTIDGECCLLDILDTAGGEEYSAMRDQYMRNAEGFIITYSINSRTSFGDACVFHDQILRVKDSDTVPMVLCGSQCDEEKWRQVTKAEGESLSKEWGCPFYETSALKRINIEEVFYDLVREIRKTKIPEKKINSKNPTILQVLREVLSFAPSSTKKLTPLNKQPPNQSVPKPPPSTPQQSSHPVQPKENQQQTTQSPPNQLVPKPPPSTPQQSSHPVQPIEKQQLTTQSQGGDVLPGKTERIMRETTQSPPNQLVPNPPPSTPQQSSHPVQPIKKQQLTTQSQGGDVLPGIFERMIDETALGVGLNLSIFPSNYQQPSITVHEAICLGMDKLWNENMKERYLETLQGHMESTQSFIMAQKKFKLSLDEAGAIAYYTSDAKIVLGSTVSIDKSPYYILNKLLATRSTESLENWKPFLHFLLQGLQKIDNISGIVYRAINVPVLLNPKTQYKAAANVVWIAFSSTSKNTNQLACFSGKETTGTWIILEIIEGKDVSDFSLFPREEEVLLLPNAMFKVEGILTNPMKELLKLNSNLDVIQMKQQPTPKRFLSMVIEEF